MSSPYPSTPLSPMSLSSGDLRNKVCLVVIDGWGISKELQGNAIANAKTPVMTRLSKECPTLELQAHGLAVGLPDGLMGNSEVGHLNIGAGRIVYQDIIRIDLSVKNNTLKDNPALLDCFAHAEKNNGRLHILGLISDGGVHSHINHAVALVKAARDRGIGQTYIHFFADGRDTAPTSAVKYLDDLQGELRRLNYGRIATITGRYFAMDRDKRWERIKVAFDALTGGVGEESSDPAETIRQRYAKNQTDEFLEPIIVDKEGCIRDKDALIFFDFRADRMRELTESFGVKLSFESDHVREDLHIVTMTQYNIDFTFPLLFPPQLMDNGLAEWLSKLHLAQYHVAETEKYAHVTFFFNGRTEKEFPLEDRKMVASPKVATYDLKPEMSCREVAQEVCKGLASGNYAFVMCNLAPPDMVGHTGSYEPTRIAVEATDAAIGEILEACKSHGYTLFVTADHGNAEKMVDAKGEPHTAHTCAPVPFIMASTKMKFRPQESSFCLRDVAPTVLHCMGLPIPVEMDGGSLLDL